MTSSNKAISAAVLVKSKGYWSYDTIFACDSLEFYHLQVFDEIDPSLNPYDLNSIDKVDILYVASHTWRWLIGLDEKKEKNLVRVLRGKCQILVMFDGWDSFDISLQPQTLDLFDITLKVNGVYHDRDLYNWRVGCDYSGAKWTEKLRQKEVKFTNQQLEKIQCAYPCFMGILPAVRDRLRRVKDRETVLKHNLAFILEFIFTRLTTINLSFIRPSEFVHFVGDLGHIQRYELLQILEENDVSGKFGVFRLLPKLCGFDNWRFNGLSEHKFREMEDWLQVNDLFTPRRNRLIYLLEMLRYQVVVSPTGFGEVCFRHGEALSLKRTLLCQDLSHVEIKFPFQDGVNVVYSRPDMSDMMDKLEMLKEEKNTARRIAEQGYDDWIIWASNYKQLLHDTLISPLGSIK